MQLSALHEYFQEFWAQTSSFSKLHLSAEAASRTASLVLVQANQLLAELISFLQVSFWVPSYKVDKMKKYRDQAGGLAQEFWQCSAVLDGFSARTSRAIAFLKFQFPSACPLLAASFLPLSSFAAVYVLPYGCCFHCPSITRASMVLERLLSPVATWADLLHTHLLEVHIDVLFLSTSNENVILIRMPLSPL